MTSSSAGPWRDEAEEPPWFVGIRPDRDAPPVGAGMLVSDRHIITCAHVVDPEAKPDQPGPGQSVYVQFQFAHHEVIPARVVEGGWFPALPDNTGDVAVLALEREPPEGAQPAPLVGTRGTRGHEFTVYGYPRLHEYEGNTSYGEIVGPAERQWLQLQAAGERGQAIEPGFSGAPAWDVNLGGVIGIVVRREWFGSDHVDPRTGYAIKSETLARYWPPLEHTIRDTRGESQREALERLLDISLTAEGGLPRVADVDIYEIGVTRSKYVTLDRPAPYVERRGLEEEISRSLHDRPFVLLVGDPTAGKSRTLIEVLRREMPDSRIIVPLGERSAPERLASLIPGILDGPAIFWLDNLDRFLGPNGVNTKILDGLSRLQYPMKVVASISSHRFEEVQRDEGEAARIAARVLGKMAVVRMSPFLEPEDIERARSLYPDDDFSERGIGQYLVAATVLEGRFDAAYGSKPEAAALVQAVVDWGRLGLDTPVLEEHVRQLFASYYRERTTRSPDASAFDQGLAWSAQKVEGSIALVYESSLAQGKAFDTASHLRAYLDGQGRRQPIPIPRSTWDYAVEILAPTDVVNLAFTALTRMEVEVAKVAFDRGRLADGDGSSAAWAALFLGELQLAEDRRLAYSLFEEAVASGVSGVVPLAQVDLAGLCSMQGDVSRARELLESALDSGDPEAAPLAQVSLGTLLVDLGEFDVAQELFESALNLDDPNATPMAQARLGGLLAGGSRSPQKSSLPVGRAHALDLPGVRVGRGDPTVPARTLVPKQFRDQARAQVVPAAQAGLGRLLAAQGERDRARALLEAAMSSGNPLVVPVAQVNLAAMLIDLGSWDEAETLLEQATESGNPFTLHPAQVLLAMLCEARGDAGRARGLLQPIAWSDEPEQGPRAADLLGDIMVRQGDFPAARRAYTRAIDSGHRDWAPMAQIDLAALDAQEDDLDAAVEALRAVAHSGHPHQGPRAADLLGDVLVEAGDDVAATAAYELAAASMHPDWRPIAQIDLAVLRANRGDRSGARLLFEEVARGGNREQAPRAADFLGDLLAGQDLVDEAIEAYRMAIDSAHPEWGPIARVDLACLLAAGSRLSEAAEHLTAAAEAANPAIAGWACLCLSDVLEEEKRPAEARKELERALALDSPPVRPFAQLRLARLDLVEANYDRAEASLSDLMTDTDLPAATITLAEAYLELAKVSRGRVDSGSAAATDTTGAGDMWESSLASAEALFDAGEIDAASELVDLVRQMSGLVPPVRAVVLRGQISLARGELDQARRSLEEALSAGDASTEAQARRYLGSVLARQEETSAARQVLLPLATSDESSHRAAALLLLGRLASLAHNTDEARNWLEEAVAAGDADVSAEARRALEELSSAAPSDRPPTAPDSSVLPPLVQAILGEVAMAEGAVSEARDWFTLAMSSDDDRARSRAASALSELMQPN